MDIHSQVLRQLNNRREGFSLEQPFYIDPDYYKLDLEMIWYRDWLFVGHDCEIPKAGNYVTLQIGDYPVLILRTREGEIRAFHNTVGTAATASAPRIAVLRPVLSVPITSGPTSTTAR